MVEYSEPSPTATDLERSVTRYARYLEEMDGEISRVRRRSGEPETQTELRRLIAARDWALDTLIRLERRLEEARAS